MSRTQKKISAKDPKRQKLHTDLLKFVSTLLTLYDPVALNFDANKDEYKPEAAAILARLKNCNSASELEQVVRQEFTERFGTDTARLAENYPELASKIWELWQKSSLR